MTNRLTEIKGVFQDEEIIVSLKKYKFFIILVVYV